MDLSEFSKAEEAVLDFWAKEKIFEATLSKTKTGEPYIFYEGPPTANGRPGIHHILSRTFKDLMPRFQTMRGRYVARKAGWDTHGLPVELEVEKRLGLKSKRDIENLVPGDKRASIVEFNKECQKSVWTYLEDWQKLTRRMGYWIDLENAYITYRPEYIETLWYIIKQIHARGFLKKDFRVQPFCPRCGTALSSHELAQGYKKVTDKAVYLKFQITNDKSQINSKLQIPNDNPVYLLSWTTTPWTLPGNVALAVNENLKYVLVEGGDENYICSKAFYEKAFERKAKDEIKIAFGLEYASAKNENAPSGRPKETDVSGFLVGLKYKPLFNIPELQNEKSHRLYAADFVTADEGTGIVHTAVMYGEDDYKLGESLGLPKVHTVGEDGAFNDLVPGFEGKLVKDEATEKAIFDYLKKRGSLLKIENISHEYPHCWRCATPLLYMAREAYVVEMSRLRKELLANNEQITWEPAHIQKGRFGEWLKEVKDWTFSRERYWGTPLPVWTCSQCENVKVVGSMDELGEQKPRNAEGEVDLHRPYIDDVVFTCECGGSMNRVPYVCDVWFDSGAMPFAQAHWPFAPADNTPQPTTSNLNIPFPADYISEAVDQTRGWFYTLHAVAALLELGPAFKNVVCLGHILDAKGLKMSKSKGNIVDPWEQIAVHGIDPIRWYLIVASLPGVPKRYDEKALRTHFNRFFATFGNSLRFLELYAAPDRSLDLEQLKPDHLLDRWISGRLNEVITMTTKQLESLAFTTAARTLAEFMDDLSNWYLRRSRHRIQAGQDASRSVLALVLLRTAQLCAPFIPIYAERIFQGVKPFIKQTLPQSVHLTRWPEATTTTDTMAITAMSKARDLVAEGLKQRMAAGVKVRQPLSRATIFAKLDPELQKIIAEELNVKEVKLVTDQEPPELQIVIDTALTKELKIEGHERDLIRQIQLKRRQARLKPQDTIKVVLPKNNDNEAVIKAFPGRLAQAVNAIDVSLNDSAAEPEIQKI